MERGTFVHVGWDDVPKNETVMNSSLVLTKKFDESGKLEEKFKARCCARGNQLTAGIDYHETFSPTLRNETLSIMLSIIAAEDFEASQIDVKQAFFLKKLRSEKYIHIPDGMHIYGVSKQSGCLKITKGLYGLPEWTPRLVRRIPNDINYPRI